LPAGDLPRCIIPQTVNTV